MLAGSLPPQKGVNNLKALNGLLALLLLGILIGDNGAGLLGLFLRSMLERRSRTASAHAAAEVGRQVALSSENRPRRGDECSGLKLRMTSRKPHDEAVFSSSYSQDQRRLHESRPPERGSKSPNSSSCGWPCSRERARSDHLRRVFEVCCNLTKIVYVSLTCLGYPLQVIT